MNSKDHSTVSQIDLAAFKRESSRSIENISILNSFEPNGCFVALDGDHLIGFIFTRVLGGTGYFGPVAVLPEEQKRGIGKLLINFAIDYLQSKCDLIGIEVRPESGKNIGLYYRMGFSTFLSTLVFEIPKKVPSDFKKDNVFLIANEQSTTENNSEIVASEKIIQELADLTKQIEPGLDFSKELNLILKKQGLIVVSKDNQGKLNGFLAYEPNLMTYIWGAIKKDVNEINQLKNLIFMANSKIQAKPLYLAINTKYNDVIEDLVRLNCRFLRGYNRMFLQKKENKMSLNFYEKNMAILRAFMG
jgi:hypothetical protein